MRFSSSAWQPVPALLGCIVAVCIGGSASGAEDASSAFQARVAPVLSAHCTKCHGGDKPKAKLNLAGPRTLPMLRSDAKLWFRVLEQIESGAMPPAGRKPLAPAERQAVAGWVRGELTDWLASVRQKEGRSKFRRLSRNEYANTIHDLFGFRPAVGRDLPSDGRVDGYDRVAAALPLSSAGAAGYVKIAEDVLDRMLKPIPRTGRTYRLWAGASEQSAGHILELSDGTMVSFNTDTTSGPLRLKSPAGRPQLFSIRVPGVHRLRLSVYAYQTDKPLLFGIYAGHTVAYPQLIDLVKILEAPPGKPTVLETEVYLRTRDVNDVAPVSDSFRLIPFGLGVQVPKNTLAKNCKGPGLAVQWVDVEEPEQPLPGDRWLCADIPPALLEKLRLNYTTLKQLPKGTRETFLAAMRTTFKRIGARFFRRELTEAELSKIIQSITRQIDGGDRLEAVFRSEAAALMTAPDFLCLIEQPGRLTDGALASRLSYFLWNSTPDKELLEVSRQGRLQGSTVLRHQTQRMLKDPKSARFVKDFVDQWLGLRMINDTTPDTKLYPEYDDLLKISSEMETQASFRRILEKNLSVREFVAPKWALVNERLARHYGLPEVAGFALQEVALPKDSPFGGIWTQAATMKVTANGTNTSPVKRGVWVAERLLGISIPPPPPNIEPIEPDIRGAKTLREQLALHRGKGSCAACHARFDPDGFALESFDVAGAYRRRYREADPDAARLPPNQRKGRRAWREGLPVDSSGKTPDGAHSPACSNCVSSWRTIPSSWRGVMRHLVTYSTGEPAAHLDQRVSTAS